MTITGKIHPKQIRAVRNFPELDSKTEVGAVAWFILQEAQKQDQWPERISVAKIGEVISNAVNCVVDTEYTMDVVRAMWHNGFVLLNRKEVVLQERFVETLYNKFPVN